MVKKRLTLVNPKGLHARASHRLSETVNQYKCTCNIRFGELHADACQILSIMMLAAPVGSVLEFTFAGRDAEACAEAVEDLVSNGLGELGEHT